MPFPYITFLKLFFGASLCPNESFEQRKMRDGISAMFIDHFVVFQLDYILDAKYRSAFLVLRFKLSNFLSYGKIQQRILMWT